MNQVFFEAVSKGKFRVDEEGFIVGPREKRVGSTAGASKTYTVTAQDPETKKILKMPAARLAWMIHYGEIPPEGMSVVPLFQDQTYDFSKEHLALVPQGYENLLLAGLRKGLDN